MDAVEVDAEMGRVVEDIRRLASSAPPAALRARSDATRWTSRQLLFHMVFGDLFVRTLLPPVQVLDRLGWSRRFATTLNAAGRPFHLINDWARWPAVSC